MKRNTEHPSRGLAVDIISSIDGNAMLDVMLLANDGGEIPASRFVLGARSPVLQQLLFNKAQSSHDVKLDYSTTVVNALVHYCRTNELLVPQSRDEASVREHVKLCECAVTFQLQGLKTLVENIASSICKAHAHLACAMYDESTIHGKSADSLKYIALGVIRRNPQDAFLPRNELGSRRYCGGVSSLEPATLQELLSDPNMCTEEINLFRAVMFWADASSITKDKLHSKMDAWTTQQLLQDRRATAKKIAAQCIDLSKIAPSDLMGIVSESGLVDEVDVSNALIQLALRVEKEGVELSKRRVGVKKKELPRLPPVPPSPPQIVYCPEESNSVVGDFPQPVGDTSSSSLETVGNKRRPKKQQPKSVTPQEKPSPNFTTPPRDAASVVSKSSPVEKKRRKPGSVGSEIRRAMGMYLREKVDSLCIHPKYSDDVTKSD